MVGVLMVGALRVGCVGCCKRLTIRYNDQSTLCILTKVTNLFHPPPSPFSLIYIQVTLHKDDPVDGDLTSK